MIKIEELLVQLEQGDELQKQAADVIRQLSGDLPQNYILVSQKPSQGLLISMATRFRHDFMMPSREEIQQQNQQNQIPDSPFLAFNMTQREKDNLLTSMNQLHEEMVREGFYQPSFENRYVKMKI